MLLDFYPKMLGCGGDLQIVILLENEYSFSGGDNARTLKPYWLVYTLLGSGDTRTLQFFPHEAKTYYTCKVRFNPSKLRFNKTLENLEKLKIPVKVEGTF